MKFILISLLIFVSIISTYGQSNSWNGLTPLHSTRADVEKLLGQPEKDKIDYRGIYKTENGKVEIVYATRPCKTGWNVPKDTILFITLIDADVGKSLEELKLDESKLSYSVDDAMYAQWRNADEGLTYYFQNVSGYLIEKGFGPKKSDNETLRCDGFPPYMPEGFYYTDFYYPFYSKTLSKEKGFYEAIQRFDELYIRVSQLHPKDEVKAYAVIYFDNRYLLKEWRNRIEDLKKFIKMRKYPADFVTIIEGGLQEDSEMEFYILPKNLPPPAPEPSLPSPQFMKNKKLKKQ